MPFPSTLENLLASGYTFLRGSVCPECMEFVEVFKTPGEREIAMDPMCEMTRPAVRHYETCGTVKPAQEPKAIKLHGVTDPNHQLIAVGWDDGVLVCQFKTAKWSYAGVPEAEFIKLRRSPFAYRIFTTNIKNKFPGTKVG